MKHILLYIFLLLTISMYSQVGINTTNPQSGVLHIDALGNNALTGVPNATQTADDVFINSTGYVAVGHAIPLTQLHIKAPSANNGAIRIEDGSQGVQRLLGSDASGNASWGFAGETPIVRGVLGAGITYTISEVGGLGNWRDSGAYIDLPPGTWMVTVGMLLITTGANASDYLPYAWIRSSLSDTAGGGYSPDIQGTTLLMSGIAYGAINGTLDGFLIIKNAGTKSKRYYYTVGYSDLNGLARTVKLVNFGNKTSGENYILAFKIRNN